MIISMQGNWTVKVKSKSASFPQQFKVIGAAAGNGTYKGEVSTPAVNVKGDQWSLAVLNNPGKGFLGSEARIKFPQKIGNNYVFEIESDDGGGGDNDFNDLVLTCSTTATLNDFIVYGNVTLYSGPCWFNPCFWKWIIIDTAESLDNALKIPELREVIAKLYPERIPAIKVNPNPPDPVPDFKPLMINLVDDVQIPAKQAQLFKTINIPVPEKTTVKKASTTTLTNISARNLSNFQSEKILNANVNLVSKNLQYDKVRLAKVIEPFRRFVCHTEPSANQILHFDEYDRSLSELAGNPYSGNGHRETLGHAITDMNGNYIFRFTQSFVDRWQEYFSDYATGEDRSLQILPDVIVKVEKFFPLYQKLYETTPYFNIGNLKRIDICMPKTKVPPVEPFCFNGNIIGEIGKVYIGGVQNNAASFAALDRNGPNNHLRANGVITVNTTHAANPTSNFSVDCACWGGSIDLKGCLFDEAKRNTGAKQIHRYTIRYKKSAAAPWQYVSENMLHPQQHKIAPAYIGDSFGPFPTNLNVDGAGVVEVPAYLNIQREAALVIQDWIAPDLSIIISLNTNIYQGSAPGTVYFRVDGYDETGKIVPNSTDMLALYIDNNRLDFGLADVHFPPSIEYIACGLYKMTASELSTALQFKFKAGDLLADPANPTLGFVNNYSLTFGKCPSAMALDMSAPVVKNNITDGVLAKNPSPVNTDAGGCSGYKGTVTDFGAAGYIDAVMKPSASGPWLTAAETFGVFSLHLTASKRVTNGYNSGIDGTYNNSTSFSILKK